jgi:hypothetical protein
MCRRIKPSWTKPDEGGHLPWIWNLKPFYFSSETVRYRFPPIYKIIVHEKFHHSIKKGGEDKEFRHAKQDS